MRRAPLLIVLLLALLAAPPARAATSRRIAGDDRYATAAAVALDRWGYSSDVYLARGDEPSDALAGAYGSGLHISPVLLTMRDALPQSTRDALVALRPTRLRILGGTASVSAALEASLRDDGYDVIRHAGADRYETAAAVARSGGESIVGVFKEKGKTALLANGHAPFDALAAGPLAAGQLYPILLTTTDALPPATTDALDDLAIAHVVVLGGSGVVSEAVVAALEASGRTVRRVAGADRTATATALADLMIEVGYTPTRAALTSATNPADALGAGPWAASDTPVLLCQTPTFCGPATQEWRTAHALEEVVVIGGTAAVSDAAAMAVTAGP